MNSEKIGSVARAGALFSLVAMSACGTTATLGLDDGFADGTEITADTYVGRTFSAMAATGSSNPGGQSTVDTATVTVEVVSVDEFIVTVPGEPAKTFTRSGTDPALLDAADGDQIYSLTMISAGTPGAMIYLAGIEGTATDPLPLFQSGFGFETPVGNRPDTATYAPGAYSMFVAMDGVADVIEFGGGGGVSLTADFGAGTILGSLGEGYGTVDADGDTAVDDIVRIDLSLDGSIDNSGFGGTIDGSGVVRFDGAATETNLGLAISNSGTVGKFYGNDAGGIVMVFDGDMSTAIELNGATTGSFAGFAQADAP